MANLSDKYSDVNGPIIVQTQITPWENYPLVLTTGSHGMAGTSSTLQWRRVGESVEVYGYILISSVSGDEARIPLPNGYTITADGSATNIVGRGQRGYSTTGKHLNILATNGDDYVNFAVLSDNAAAQDGSVPVAGNQAMGAGNRLLVNFSVRVEEFANESAAISTSAIDSETFDLSTEPSFTSGGAGRITKIGNVVTFTMTSSANHSSTFDVSTGDGFLAEKYRPASSIANLYTYSGNTVYFIQIQDTGKVRFYYRTWAGGNASKDQTFNATVSWIVDEDI